MVRNLHNTNEMAFWLKLLFNDSLLLKNMAWSGVRAGVTQSLIEWNLIECLTAHD